MNDTESDKLLFPSTSCGSKLKTAVGRINQTRSSRNDSGQVTGRLPNLCEIEWRRRVGRCAAVDPCTAESRDNVVATKGQ